jgi:hypothetical protein
MQGPAYWVRTLPTPLRVILSGNGCCRTRDCDLLHILTTPCTNPRCIIQCQHTTCQAGNEHCLVLVHFHGAPLTQYVFYAACCGLLVTQSDGHSATQPDFVR